MPDLPISLKGALDNIGRLDIVLVIGAGCSVDEPTNLELGSAYAQRAHAALVRRGVIRALDTPWDLSAVADALVAAEGTQSLLVNELPIQAMKVARPNQGYLIAAALQADGFIRSVLSLNYDSAGASAIGELGLSSAIHLVESKSDLPIHGTRTFVHLNGTAHAPGEELILTTSALDTAWVGQWQQVVATQAMNVPLIAFVGLGSQAKLLSETLALVRAAVGTSTEFILVGPGEQSGTEFAGAIGAAGEACVDATWTRFMEACAEIALATLLRLLSTQFPTIELQAGTIATDCSSVLAQISKLGLIDYGIARQAWTTRGTGYAVHPAAGGDLMGLADVVHFVSEAEIASETTAHFHRSGVVSFGSEGGSVTKVDFFSPEALMDYEVAVAKVLTGLGVGSSRPDVIFISRTNAPIGLSAPESIIRDELDDDDVIRAEAQPQVRYVRDMRMDHSLYKKLLG